MVPPSKEEVTGLLLDWSGGNVAALEKLMPIVTHELRRMAGHYFRSERPSHTLQPTALVNELYLRLADRRKVRWQNRAQFFAFAGETMRRILVDHARAQKASKRGSGVANLSLDEAVGVPDKQNVDLIALDDALETLAQLSPRQAKIIELRCFAGLSLEETASVLEISEATVSRDWTAARAWLFRELSG